MKNWCGSAYAADIAAVAQALSEARQLCGDAGSQQSGGGVTGWNDASETFNVTRELVKRGYTKEQIAKIWSGNILRVLAEVETVAKKLSKAP